MIVHGVLAEAEPGRNFLIQEALGLKAQDLHLAMSEQAARDRGAWRVCFRFHYELCCRMRKVQSGSDGRLDSANQFVACERPREYGASSGIQGARKEFPFERLHSAQNS